MFSINEFVKEWGYVAVFLGSLVEGESIIITASILAAAGYLSIVKVTFIAFIGTLFADQSLYFVGYFYGDRLIAFLERKFPKIRIPLEKALKFLNKYNTLYIMVFRFIYSIRTISPVIIGSQKVPFIKFAILNFLSAILWSVLSCSLGYFIGEAVIKSSALLQKILFVVFIIVVVSAVFYKQKRKKKKLKLKEENNETV